MPRQFHIVDVFARERYAGNQLAVVTDAGDLDSEQMQAVAAEMDYSETTFVTGPETTGGWPVRIFTPTEEVPFAGHPTLGTASVVRRHLADGDPETVTLDLEVGGIPVEVRDRSGGETLWMSQQSPLFGEELPQDDLAAVLGLEPDQVDDNWPVQVVSTGLPTIIVPLTGREALEAVELDRAAYDTLVDGRAAKLVHTVCRDPREHKNDLAVRMFAPHFGVPEDPATGSANGCLAAYLSQHGYLDSPTVDVRVEQGHEMGRPSLLYLTARQTDDDIDVEVGGRVVPVARGELL